VAPHLTPASLRLCDLHEHVRAFGEAVKNSLGLQAFHLHARPSPLDGAPEIYLDSIVVARGARKAGLGSKAISSLCRFADDHHASVVLEPADQNWDVGTTSRSRLVRFYKRFGFVENKGRHKDFRLGAGVMVRTPRSS
jgi:GNAT superfamily N-acetyltransferase